MNDFSPSGVKQRRAIIISAVVAVIIFAFVVYKGWDSMINNEVIDESIIVTGSFTCLPLKSGEPTDDNCVLGVESRDGKSYALDISQIQDANTDLKADDTIAVTGWLRPKSENEEGWDDYEIERVILVNTLLRTR